MSLHVYLDQEFNKNNIKLVLDTVKRSLKRKSVDYQAVIVISCNEWSHTKPHTYRVPNDLIRHCFIIAIKFAERYIPPIKGNSNRYYGNV